MLLHIFKPIKIPARTMVSAQLNTNRLTISMNCGVRLRFCVLKVLDSRLNRTVHFSKWKKV